MASSSVRSVRLTPSTELWSFVAIGALCTGAYAVLYTLFRHGGLAPGVANALALAATLGANFAANRRFTFDATGQPLRRQLGAYAVAYGLGLAVSSIALAVLLSVLGHPKGALDTTAAVAAGLGATVVRYQLMRSWVFAPPRMDRTSAATAARPAPRPELIALLVLAAGLNLWALSKNGWANDYYSAAVRSMSTSWHNFLYDSFDPSGVMTLDKPPLSLWVQALSVRAFGFHPLSMLVPQALIGVGTVALVYDLVRRRFGRAAAFVGGLVLALTPITVAISRHNNPDALLILLCTAALWFTVRAFEDGRTRWIVWAGVMVGLAFETKMLVAFMVLPGIVAAWMWVAPRGRLAAARQLLAGGTAMVLVGGAWPLLMTLTPAADRPWISGTSDNSIWSLIFGYNGLGRIDGQQGGPGGAAGGGPGGGGGFFGGATGPFRLLNSAMGGQAGWLLGAAVVGGIALVVASRLRRTDPRTGWIVAVGGAFATTAIAFSFAKGIFHPYYVSLLAPFVAALVGATAGHLLSDGRAARVVGPLALGAGMVTELVVLNDYSGQLAWLRPLLIAGAVLAAAAFAYGLHLRWRAIVLSAAIFLLLLAPATWAFDTLGHATSSTFPAGGPSQVAGGGVAGGGFGGPPGGFAPAGGGGGPFGGGVSSLDSVVAYVNAHGGGTIGVDSQSGASSSIIQSGAKVAGIGGFSGRESQVSVEWLARAVQSGRIRWVLVTGNGGGGFQDGRIGASELMAAVQKVGTKALTTSGGTLYDLSGKAGALLAS